MKTSYNDVNPGADFALQHKKILREQITVSTQRGGLKKLPARFELDVREMYQDRNVFTVLYLDHKLYERITDGMVEGNYRQIITFLRTHYTWVDDEARTEALDITERAYQKLKNADGRRSSFSEADKARYEQGIQAFQPLLQAIVAAGELTAKHRSQVLNRAALADISTHEIGQHLFIQLAEKGFKPRNARAHQDPFKNSWMTDERWHANQSMPFKAAPEAGRAAVFPDGYGRLIFKYAAIFGGFMALIGLVPLAQDIFSYYPYSYYLRQYGFYVLVVAIVWFVWWIIYIKKIEKI